MALKTVIIIGGPTAVGKTAMAIRVAEHFRTEIISADSRQCFRELNIGVARPSPDELAAVPHHFIASHSIHEKVTAATFEAYALEKAAAIFEQGDVAVMVGGTGLYIRAFCDGFDPVPEVPETISQEVRQAYAAEGLGWLQAAVQQADPQYFATGEVQNPQRLMRALEVVRATGQSVLYFRSGAKTERPFRTIKIGLQLPKEQLHDNINTRVDAMMAAGQLEEVRQLLPFQHHNALQTVGYRELFAHLSGGMPLHDAIAAIKQNTRQYAKRQLTWFRKDQAFTWFTPFDNKAMIEHLEEVVNKG